LVWIIVSVVTACQPRGRGEATGEASSRLSYAALRVYSIQAMGYGEPWCPHGSVATDAVARCNDPTQTVLARIPITWDPNGDGVPDPCHPVTASLTFQRQEWTTASQVDVRRILRPVIDPPAGLAADCAPPGVAGWDTTGAEPWAVPGARGWGIDASAEAFSLLVAADGTALVTVDLTARDAAGAPLGTLVDDCAPTGDCLLGLYASAHVWEYPGTFSLFVTCDAAPPGGSSSSGGASSSSGAGGAPTSSTSTSSPTSSTGCP
jgi:hypothetical protein